MNKLILSEDGSHTVHSDRFGVTYHSKYGSIQETQTVFLDAGLQHQIDQGKKEISIFEMGFGTGLNALMTYEYIQNLDLMMHYHTVEAYPISSEMAASLNYVDLLHLDTDAKDAFLRMHNSTSFETARFHFKKDIARLQDLHLDNNNYDIIYYDAFAPSAQEELWTEEMMHKLFLSCRSGAVLVTYCAKGAFKRALKGAGFQVEGLPGPKGKREMTRAVKA